jgi:hypothetical protein
MHADSPTKSPYATLIKKFIENRVETSVLPAHTQPIIFKS